MVAERVLDGRRAKWKLEIQRRVQECRQEVVAVFMGGATVKLVQREQAQPYFEGQGHLASEWIGFWVWLK